MLIVSQAQDSGFRYLEQDPLPQNFRRLLLVHCPCDASIFKVASWSTRTEQDIRYPPQPSIKFRQIKKLSQSKKIQSIAKLEENGIGYSLKFEEE